MTINTPEPTTEELIAFLEDEVRWAKNIASHFEAGEEVGLEYEERAEGFEAVIRKLRECRT